jgi:hypothetical protein
MCSGNWLFQLVKYMSEERQIPVKVAYVCGRTHWY